MNAVDNVRLDRNLTEKRLNLPFQKTMRMIVFNPDRTIHEICEADDRAQMRWLLKEFNNQRVFWQEDNRTVRFESFDQESPFK